MLDMPADALKPSRPSRREASLGFAPVSALTAEWDPLGLATLLRGNLGDLS